MDAHHVDGKEFKTIYLKFLDTIKKKEDEFVLSIYPEHGNFESAEIEYHGMIGWEFKETKIEGVAKSIFKIEHKTAWMDGFDLTYVLTVYSLGKFFQFALTGYRSGGFGGVVDEKFLYLEEVRNVKKFRMNAR